MSDIHTWRGSADAGVVQCVFHMDTTGTAISASGNNAAGVPWPEALIKSGYSTGHSRLLIGSGANGDGTIAPDEAELLSLGQRFEIVDSVTLISSEWEALSLANKQTFIRNRRTILVAAKVAQIILDLNYFGLAFT